jgi:hypothetical protein
MSLVWTSAQGLMQNSAAAQALIDAQTRALMWMYAGWAVIAGIAWWNYESPDPVIPDGWILMDYWQPCDGDEKPPKQY